LIHASIFHIALSNEPPAFTICIEGYLARANLFRETTALVVALTGIGMNVDRPGKGQVLDSFEAVLRKQDASVHIRRRQPQTVTAGCLVIRQLGVRGKSVARSFHRAAYFVSDFGRNGHHSKRIHLHISLLSSA
jgi:hypothetical protein